MRNMDTLPERENVGLFDDRYRAFLATIVQVRPPSVVERQYWRTRPSACGIHIAL